MVVPEKNALIDLWKRIRRRFISRQIAEPEAVLASVSTAENFQPVIYSCIPLLHSCPTGTILYLLDCLCPRDFSILDLVHLDLSQPRHHKRLPALEVRLKPKSYEGPLSHLRAHTSMIPAKDYPRFWLELTRSCLLTCPLDPYYYRASETDEDLFCEKLHSELIERILKID